MDNGKKQFCRITGLKRWSMRTNGFGRNPKYFNFDNLAAIVRILHHSFVCRKQCNELHSRIWLVLYRCKQKSPSWTGVNYLYNFLVNNKGRTLCRGNRCQRHTARRYNPAVVRGAPHFDHSPVVVQVGSLQVFGTYLWQPIRTTGLLSSYKL